MSSALALYNAVRGSSSTPDTKKQVDFITDLPLEVVLCYIVPRIVMDDFYLPKPLPCFQVCRAWNERIVPVLTGIPFYMRFNEGLWSTDDWMFVESVTPYIKSLFIGKTTPFIISQLARRLQFPSINDLTLTVTSLPALMLPEIMNMQRILYNDRSIPVPEPLHLLRLLNQCPTLVQLKIEFNETIVFTDIQHSATYPNIRHLELRYNPHTCGYPRAPFKPTFDVSLVLFKHFPCLHRLAVCYPRPQYLHMQAIFQYCPNLQQLILGYMPDHLLPEGTNILQGGLRLIALHGESPEGHLITQLLKDHASTIESLAVECVGWMVLPASNSPAGRVLFPRLRSLYLHWEMSGCPMQLARSVILRAPNLESAIVDRGGVKGEMLEALIDRPLRRIDLLCTPWSNGASELRFLDHHVHLGRSSTLEDIRCIITREYAEPEVRHMRRIHPNAPFTQLCDGWMLSITALQQLRSLELLVENTADELTAFLQHISQGCRSLENLTLEFQCFSFNIQWILPLAQHEKLNKMVIVSARFPDDMSTLLQHFSRLQAFDLKLKTIDRRGLLIDIPPSRFL